MFKTGDRVRYVGSVALRLRNQAIEVLDGTPNGYYRVFVVGRPQEIFSVSGSALRFDEAAMRMAEESAPPAKVPGKPPLGFLESVAVAEELLQAAEQQAQEAVQKAREQLAQAQEYQARQDAENAAKAALQARIDAVIADKHLAQATSALLNAIHEALVNGNYTADRFVAKHREVLAPLAAKHGFEIVVVGDGSGVMLKKVSYAE